MSRGHARENLINRIRAIIERNKWLFPFDETNVLRAIEVRSQYSPEANTGLSNAPEITVKLLADKEEDFADNSVCKVLLTATLYAPDSEQGFRDGENILEAIKIDLKSSPFLNDGYKMIGPWVLSPDEVYTRPTCRTFLAFDLHMPAIQFVTGPDGQPLEA